MQGFRFWCCCQWMSCRSCAPLHPAAEAQPGGQPLLQQPRREGRRGRQLGWTCCGAAKGRVPSSVPRATRDGTFICSHLVSLPHSGGCRGSIDRRCAAVRSLERDVAVLAGWSLAQFHRPNVSASIPTHKHPIKRDFISLRAVTSSIGIDRNLWRGCGNRSWFVAKFI